MATKWTLSTVVGIIVLALIGSFSWEWYQGLIELSWQFKFVVPGTFILSIIFGAILGWGQSSVENTFSDTLHGNVIGAMIIGLVPALFIVIIQSAAQVPIDTELFNALFMNTWLHAVPLGLSIGLLFFVTYVTSFFTIFIPNW
jgi:hypothetical protein